MRPSERDVFPDTVLIGTNIRARARNRIIIHDLFSITSTSTSFVTHVTYCIIRELTSLTYFLYRHRRADIVRAIRLAPAEEANNGGMIGCRGELVIHSQTVQYAQMSLMPSRASTIV